MGIGTILFIFTLLAFIAFGLISKRIGDKQKAEWMNSRD